MEKMMNSVIVKRTYGKPSSFFLEKGELKYFKSGFETLSSIQFVNVYYIQHIKPVMLDYTYDEVTDTIVMVMTTNSRFTNKIVLTDDDKIVRKNSKPTSYHDSEDLCPSCYSPVNIDKDLDENDCCNLCRPDIPGPSLLNPESIGDTICQIYNDQRNDCLKPDYFTFDKDILTGGLITLTINTNKSLPRNNNYHIIHRGNQIDLKLISFKSSYEMTTINLGLSKSYLIDPDDLTNEDILNLRILISTYD